MRTAHAPRLPTGEAHDTVSVVMPVHNGADTIVESVESALAQTHPVLEVIVVDDGSTDGTAERLRDFDERVRIIRIEQGGHARARNVGIRAARGHWVAALDADDLWLPGKLEHQMTLAREADVIYTATRNFGNQGNVGETTDIADVSAPADALGALLLDNYVTHSSALARRDALLAVGGYEATLRTACDWDLWLKLADAGYRFRGVPEILVHYRWSPGTNSRRNHGLNTRNRLRVLARAVRRSGLRRTGLHRVRLALHNVCRTTAWFAAPDQPLFALRWYMLAQIFRPTDYATWRELAALLGKPLLDAVRGPRE